MKIWRDPDQPGRNYSLEDLQTPWPPVRPVDAPPYYGDWFLYAIGQRRPEIEDVAQRISQILQAEPLFGAAGLKSSSRGCRPASRSWTRSTAVILEGPRQPQQRANSLMPS